MSIVQELTSTPGACCFFPCCQFILVTRLRVLDSRHGAHHGSRKSHVFISSHIIKGPAHAYEHSLDIFSIQETKSWDFPNLELPGYVCDGCRCGFATLLVSERFCTLERSWKFEERCTTILFGTTLVMTVYAPESGKSTEMYDAFFFSSVLKVLKERTSW